MSTLVHPLVATGSRSKRQEQSISRADRTWIGSMVDYSFSWSIICSLGYLVVISGKYLRWFKSFARSIIFRIGVYRGGMLMCWPLVFWRKQLIKLETLLIQWLRTWFGKLWIHMANDASASASASSLIWCVLIYYYAFLNLWISFCYYGRAVLDWELNRDLIF